ncbi:MAG: GspE/PulE family protein [Gammaproteobacteria bacterium]|nr:GspE/PulE family protein [Gammaproteobacteria bacterium]
MQLNEKLKTIFLDKIDITEDQFQAYIDEAKNDAIKLASLCIANNILSRNEAGMIIGDYLNCAYINLDETLFQTDVVNKLPKEIAEKYSAIPLYQFGEHITLVTCFPEDTTTYNVLKSYIPKLDVLFSLPDEIQAAISVHYKKEKDIEDIFTSFDLASLDRINDEKSAELSEVVAISSNMVMLALKEGASDIHIEPKENSCIIRFRIDGVLQKKFTFPGEITRALISRYKILSGLDISEKRKPQDGRISFPTPIKNVDIRLSVLPTVHGETIVMRLLGSLFDTITLNLNALNLTERVSSELKESLAQPNGLILVTGPTGSGKSTTLYAALNHLDSPGIKIMTVEDPVEYEMFNFSQTQVDSKADRSFASVLRSILRQDPDVLLVGEIRDTETANIAAEAALTGHIVLSTLHTNNAIQAITRLSEMGVEPYVMAPSLTGILAQRLPRKLCNVCKEAYTPDAAELQPYFKWEPDTSLPTLFRPVGCIKCSSGYKGRIGIHEFLKVDLYLKELILQQKSYNEILQYARRSGYKDMRFDGFIKVLQGLTTIDEIVRVTNSD